MPFLTISSLPIWADSAAVLALILSVIGLLRRKRPARVPVPTDPEQLMEVLAAHEEALETIKKKVDSASNAISVLEERQLSTLKHVSLVRFRAFPEVGSDLSFSLALLDSLKNGVVITSLFGREETRVYAKPITAGQSQFRLSPEEEKALDTAMRDAASDFRH